MNTLNAIFNKYKCDKGALKHNYDRVYQPLFQHLVDGPFNMLEIGVFKGNSIESWIEFFPEVSITGLDIFCRVPQADIQILKHKRVSSFNCDSTKGPTEQVLNSVKDTPKFKVIIDDGLHTYDAQRATFLNFIDLLDDDGVYIIEDMWLFDTHANKAHPWVKSNPTDYSDAQYKKLMDIIKPYDVTIHDLRKDHHPDTCLIEIRKPKK